MQVHTHIILLSTLDLVCQEYKVYDPLRADPLRAGFTKLPVCVVCCACGTRNDLRVRPELFEKCLHGLSGIRSRRCDVP